MNNVIDAEERFLQKQVDVLLVKISKEADHIIRSNSVGPSYEEMCKSANNLFDRIMVDIRRWK